MPGSSIVRLRFLCLYRFEISRGILRGWIFVLDQDTLVPKRAPTPPVAAMASAPQNATRSAPIQGEAPPTRAASAPRAARKTRDAAETTRTVWEDGANMTVRMGKAAPTVNVAAEASAACRGRAVNFSESPSSSRAW